MRCVEKKCKFLKDGEAFVIAKCQTACRRTCREGFAARSASALVVLRHIMHHRDFCVFAGELRSHEFFVTDSSFPHRSYPIIAAITEDYYVKENLARPNIPHSPQTKSSCLSDSPHSQECIKPKTSIQHSMQAESAYLSESC